MYLNNQQLLLIHCWPTLYYSHTMLFLLLVALLVTHSPARDVHRFVPHSRFRLGNNGNI